MAKGYKRIGARLALVLVIAAVAAPTAQARLDEGGGADAAVAAGARSRADFGSPTVAPSPRGRGFGVQGLVEAQAIRGRRDFGTETSAGGHPTTVVDWAEAGIGSALMIAALLAATAAAGGIRIPRRPAHD